MSRTESQQSLPSVLGYSPFLRGLQTSERCSSPVEPRLQKKPGIFTSTPCSQDGKISDIFSQGSSVTSTPASGGWLSKPTNSKKQIPDHDKKKRGGAGSVKTNTSSCQRKTAENDNSKADRQDGNALNQVWNSSKLPPRKDAKGIVYPGSQTGKKTGKHGGDSQTSIGSGGTLCSDASTEVQVGSECLVYTSEGAGNTEQVPRESWKKSAANNSNSRTTLKTYDQVSSNKPQKTQKTTCKQSDNNLERSASAGRSHENLVEPGTRSPVDFIDRAIAIIKRDKALAVQKSAPGNRPEGCSEISSSSTDVTNFSYESHDDEEEEEVIPDTPSAKRLRLGTSVNTSAKSEKLPVKSRPGPKCKKAQIEVFDTNSPTDPVGVADYNPNILLKTSKPGPKCTKTKKGLSLSRGRPIVNRTAKSLNKEMSNKLRPGPKCRTVQQIGDEGNNDDFDFVTNDDNHREALRNKMLQHCILSQDEESDVDVDGEDGILNSCITQSRSSEERPSKVSKSNLSREEVSGKSAGKVSLVSSHSSKGSRLLWLESDTEEERVSSTTHGYDAWHTTVLKDKSNKRCCQSPKMGKKPASELSVKNNKCDDATRTLESPKRQGDNNDKINLHQASTLRIVMTPLRGGTCGVENFGRFLSPAAVVAAAEGDEQARLCNVLKDVVAYVEVRSGHDNRSMGVRTQLRALGAHVVEKLIKEVTHVVFNEGMPGTLKRAREQGCHLVSVLWIEECKNAGHRVPEVDFPALNLEKYKSTSAVTKFRKPKSLQPDFEEGKSEERINKLLKRIKNKDHAPLPEGLDLNIAGSDARDGVSLSKGPSTSKTSPSKSATCRRRLDTQGVPSGAELKNCSILLKRLNVDNNRGIIHEEEISSMPPTSKKQRKKLMPLQRPTLDSSPIEDFDPRQRLIPQCPYIEPSGTQKVKEIVPLRRSARTSGDKIDGLGPPLLSQGSAREEKMNTRKSQGRKSRRSSFIFQGKPPRVKRPSAVARRKERVEQKRALRTVVCTFMHRRDIEVVAAVLKQLGGWKLESTVTSQTSHVVCGDAKRTINLLRGIAYGCWIVHQEWVMRSLEAGQWLDEEPFEVTLFPAAQQCRVARETLRSGPNIFSTVGAIYIAESTCPPRADLQELLRLCGGHVVPIARKARVIVGILKKRALNPNVVFVNERWVLDSIQENMALPTYNYSLKKEERKQRKKK